jgi:hypothetical protein
MRSATANLGLPFEGRSLGLLPGLVLALAVLVLVLPIAAGAAPLRAPGAPTAASATTVPAAALPALNASTEAWYHLVVHGAAPTPRDDPGLVYDAKDGYTLLFGGCAKTPCPLGDTWRFANGGWLNMTTGLASAPGARAGATMVYDGHDGYVLLFGGAGNAGLLADTWVFQFGQWTHLPTSLAPSPRANAAIAYDAADSEVVLFGGSGAQGQALSDTWTFAGGSWTNRTASVGPAPPARLSAGFAYDAVDREALLFGGSGACGTYCSDAWTFSGNHWMNATLTGGAPAPTGRTQPTLAYDDGRSVVVLEGGQNAQVLADTWTFVHGQWTLLTTNTTAGPGARADGGAVFDSTDGYLIFLGGHSATGPRSGVWLLLTPLSGSIVPQYTQLTPGQADEFVSAVVGGLGSDNVSWNFGDGTPTVSAPVAGHTYLIAGNFPVTMTATDQLGVTASSAVTISVTLPPITIAISTSLAAPHVGQTVSLTASASGGTGPYTFVWSGDISGCSAPTSPTLTCSSTLPVTLTLAVTVTDVPGHSASKSTTVTMNAPAAGVTSSGNPPALGGTGSGLSPSFTSAYLALAILATCAVGVFTYRAGRRREAAQRPPRPLCYAVPAWSETPPEFDAPPAVPPLR